MSLAKLRLHTDITLRLLKASTISLGKLFRCFLSKVCSIYDTRELPQEEATRGKREAALRKLIAAPNEAGPSNTMPSDTQVSNQPPSGKELRLVGRKERLFNLNTYKMHSLGDYVDCILQFGMTDSYSTQLVSLYTQLYVSYDYN